jgi:hypothetical protein
MQCNAGSPKKNTRFDPARWFSSSIDRDSHGGFWFVSKLCVDFLYILMCIYSTTKKNSGLKKIILRFPAHGTVVKQTFKHWNTSSILLHWQRLHTMSLPLSTALRLDIVLMLILLTTTCMAAKVSNTRGIGPTANGYGGTQVPSNIESTQRKGFRGIVLAPEGLDAPSAALNAQAFHWPGNPTYMIEANKLRPNTDPANYGDVGHGASKVWVVDQTAQFGEAGLTNEKAMALAATTPAGGTLTEPAVDTLHQPREFQELPTGQLAPPPQDGTYLGFVETGSR